MRRHTVLTMAAITALGSFLAFSAAAAATPDRSVRITGVSAAIDGPVHE
ncbi:hypothetical protein ACIBQ1_29850 [Nonomuraea sp. NPDC050153]